jgi:hypothetical protein
VDTVFVDGQLLVKDGKVMRMYEGEPLGSEELYSGYIEKETERVRAVTCI